MAPDYVANFRLNYHSRYVAGLNLIAELQSIGDYWMDAENTREYSGYTIGNLKANYAIYDAFELHARVMNISDKSYALQAEIRYGRTRIQPGLPRTFYVGLKYHF